MNIHNIIKHILLLFDFYFDEYEEVLRDNADSLIKREKYLPKQLY